MKHFDISFTETVIFKLRNEKKVQTMQRYKGKGLTIAKILQVGTSLTYSQETESHSSQSVSIQGLSRSKGKEIHNMSAKPIG
jgi:hypothetical protein